MSDNFHLQLYRGTTAQNDAYTGPAGELTVDTTLSKLRLHDGSTAGGTVIGSMPTGSIIPYAGSTAPDGYLLCDGSAISRTTYSALFAIIGITYGEGDGNSTFNLPNSNDRVLQGAGTRGVVGTTLNESLPNIKGGIASNGNYAGLRSGTPYGAFTQTSGTGGLAGENIANARGFDFDASRSSSTYQDNAPVQQDALCITYVIKF